MKIMGISVAGLHALRFILGLVLVAAVIVIVVLQSRDARALTQRGSKEDMAATTEHDNETDAMEELGELAELHAQGALTDWEYSSKKKQVLNL